MSLYFESLRQAINIFGRFVYFIFVFVFVLQQFKIFEMEVNSVPLVYLAVSSSLRLHLLSLLCAQHTQIHAVNMIQDIGQINTNTKRNNLVYNIGKELYEKLY